MSDSSTSRRLELIERTPHPAPTLIEHVRVNHRGAYIAMPQQLLDRSDVVPGLEEVRREGMPRRMARRGAADARGPRRLF